MNNALVRRAPALGIAVVLLVTAIWYWWPERDHGVDTTAFEQAVADLAVAPAVGYRNQLGGAELDLRFTATGHAIGTVSFAGLTAPVLELDGRLFIRLPDEVGVVSGLTGRWVTMTEELGATMRHAMTPSALAVALSRMLSQAQGHGIEIAEESLDGKPVLRAALPLGALYVSAESPHRVLRFDPAGRLRGGGDGPEAPPAPPELPEFPELPSTPEPSDTPAPTEVPELPEVPEASSVPELPPLPPEPPAPPEGLQAFVRDATIQQPPDANVGSAVLGAITSARTDLTPMSEAEVGRLYDDLRSAAQALDDSVNSDVVLHEQPPVVGACGPASCAADVNVEVEHANGSQVPAQVTVAMTVDGQPAGQCDATGALPATGTGRLGCTNDSPEWAAAYRPGGQIDAHASVVAHAMTSDEVALITQALEREAEGAGGQFIEACPKPSDAVDTGVEEVLVELGITRPASRIEHLCGRIGQRTAGQLSEDVLTDAHVRDTQGVIARLPVDRLNPDSARRVVERVLDATDRAGLYRWLNVLRVASDATLRVQAGTRIHLNVGQHQITIGDRELDLAATGIGPETRDDHLDLVWLRPDGTLEAQQVLGSAVELADESRAREIERTMIGFRLGGQDRVFTLNIREDGHLDHLFLERDHLLSTRPPVDDFDQVTPRELLARRPRLRASFRNPPQTTIAYVAVIIGDDVHLPPGNDRRLSGRRVDAEVRAIRAGDLRRAVEYAAEHGTPDQPARVVVGSTRSPCAGERPPGAPQSCSVELANEWRRLTNGLPIDQQQNLYQRAWIVTRLPYGDPGARQNRATTTASIEALHQAGLVTRVMSVDGAIRPTAAWLVLTLMNLQEARLPGGERSTQPARPARTIANAFRANGGQLEVASYRLDVPKTAAIANAVESTQTPAQQLTSVEGIARNLYTPLHQQGVCI